MSAPREIETVLFDVDGTLIDSNEAHAVSWLQSLLEHGIDATMDQIRPLVGMGGDKLLPIMGLEENSDQGQAIARRKADIFDRLLPDLVATPGARPLLEYLREQRMNLVIATSANDRELNALLERAGIDDLIPKRTSKDDASHSKPDPDIVQAALTKANARREASVLIGDTPYDIEAGRRAGIPTIALRCGGYWSDDRLAGAIEIFDDPAELLAHWREPDGPNKGSQADIARHEPGLPQSGTEPGRRA